MAVHALANSIFERCDDGSEAVIGIFTRRARSWDNRGSHELDPTTLADRTFELIDNDYGQYDDLIGVLTPPWDRMVWST